MTKTSKPANRLSNYAAVRLPTAPSVTPKPSPFVANTTPPTKQTTWGESLVASAATIRTASLGTASSRHLNALKKAQGSVVGAGGWQEDAWGYYNLVGELRSVLTGLAHQGSGAILQITHQEDDESEATVVEDSDVLGALTDLAPTRATMTALIERALLNLAVAGELWLMRTPEQTSPTGETVPEMWRIFSISEISLDGSKVVISELGTPSGEQQKWELEEVQLVRVWRPHPRYSEQATSALEGARTVLAQIVTLDQYTSAQAESRLAGAGILLTPQSASTALGQPITATPASDPYTIPEQVSSGADEFTRTLVDNMVEPIRDRASAASVVPLVLTVPDESIDKFKHLTFQTPLDDTAAKVQEASLRRLALALDCPPEFMLGTSGMNHWGAWLMQENTVRTHISAPLNILCQALTEQYLWGWLTDRGMSEEEARKYGFQAEVDHLIIRTNRELDAKHLYSMGIIDEEALREATGFTEADAPENPLSPVEELTLRALQAKPELWESPGAEELLNRLTDLIGDKTPTPALVNGVTVGASTGSRTGGAA